MSLRKKTLSSIFIALVVMISFLYLYSTKVVSSGFAHLEERDAQLNINRLSDALQAEVDNLTVKLADWAAWDDAYKYVQDANKEFEKSNLVTSTMGSMKIHMISFWKMDRSPIFAKNVDFEGSETTVAALTPEEQKFITSNDYFFTFKDENEKKQGIAYFPNVGPVIVSALPVVTSEGTGPIKGVLISTRRLHEGFFEKLSKVTHLKLDRIDSESKSVTDDFLEAKKSLNGDSLNFVKVLSEKDIAGYTKVKDIFGKDVLWMKLSTPREVHAQGQSTIQSFMFSIFAVGLVLLVLIMAILEGSVLARVSSLVSDIKKIESSGDLSLRVKKHSPDEIGNLSDSMNTMLQVIDASKKQVRLLLDNAGQGFFSFNREGVVAKESSTAVQKMFGVVTANTHVAGLLQQNEAEWKVLLETLFSGALSFKDLAFLCPNQVLVNGRLIQLEYRDVNDRSGKLEQVMVVATDITELKALEAKNQKEQERNLAVIKVLSSKNDFLELIEMAEKLKDTVHDVKEFKRALHTLKGGFAFLECKAIANQCHQWEQKLADSQIPSQWKLIMTSACDGVSATLSTFIEENKALLQIKSSEAKVIPVAFTRIRSLLDTAQSLGSPQTLVRALENLLEREPETIFGYLDSAWQKTAENLGKKVSPLKWQGENATLIPELYSGVLKSLIHVVRNSADHGIEAPEEREMLGKTPEGHFVANLTLQNGIYTLIFNDDGAGADLEKIKAKAQKQGITLPQDEDKIIDLLFSDGFSTKSDVTENSGRGVGLDALRTEAQKLGGGAWARNHPNGGLEIRVTFQKQDLLKGLSIETIGAIELKHAA